MQRGEELNVTRPFLQRKIPELPFHSHFWQHSDGFIRGQKGTLLFPSIRLLNTARAFLDAGASLQSICSLSLSLGLISSRKKTFCYHCKNSHWPSSNSQPSLTQYWRVWCSGQKHKGTTPGILWHLQTLFFKLVKDQKKNPNMLWKSRVCMKLPHPHDT